MQGGWEVMANYQRRALQRRIRTNRPVLEMMTEFWENHLNVPVNGDAQFTYRAAYGDLIREHALGKFSDLLVGAITHPAMLIYLDQATSTKRHPNENLGRELLECHTVGEGNFTEDHVKASARILTGYTVDMWETWQALYNPEEHWRGTVKVMGFKDSNKKKDGQDLTRRYLEYLAHHPATARRIAQKLAVKFVRDEPSAGLVARLAKVYLKNDTEIVPVLRALVAVARVPAFGGAQGPRPRRGHRRDVPRARHPDGQAAGRRLRRQRAAVAGRRASASTRWPGRAPTVSRSTTRPWSTPGRLMSSMSVHYTVSNGWWPTKGVHRPEGKDWLPKVRVRFDDLVDHLSRSLLHVPASDRLQKACRQATGYQAQRDHRPGARPRRVGHGPAAHDVPRLPRIHEQVTPA